MNGEDSMTERVTVAVVGGGRSGEHAVSLASAAAVADTLRAGGHEVVALTIGEDGRWHDAASQAIGLGGAVTVLQSCDVTFPVLHGPNGEDGTLAALCELAGVRYVGSGVGAGALAMDKWATKLVAQAVGVAVAPAILVHRGDPLAGAWQGPVVVKPAAAGSSLGVTLVHDENELQGAVDAALAFDERVLVEQLVTGREVDIAVIDLPDGGRRLSPPLEIGVSQGIFDFETKYDGSADFRVPAALDDAERRALEAAALTVFEAVGCRGLARVDFFLTDDGLVLNEVNTMPGMTGASQLPRMFAADGLPYPELVDLLVRAALR